MYAPRKKEQRNYNIISLTSNPISSSIAQRQKGQGGASCCDIPNSMPLTWRYARKKSEWPLMVLSAGIPGSQQANVQEGGLYDMTKGPKQGPSEAQMCVALECKPRHKPDSSRTLFACRLRIIV
jgi:hypothetical protein